MGNWLTVRGSKLTKIGSNGHSIEYLTTAEEVLHELYIKISIRIFFEWLKSIQLLTG